MASAESSLPHLLRKLRIEAGLTQSELARQAGCSQSAVSMFEAGRRDALSREKLASIAERLGLDPSRLEIPGPEPAAGSVAGFCPVDECPSNVPFVVRGRLCFNPTIRRVRAEGRAFCPFCGELLETRCSNPECNAPAHRGSSVCPECGTAYVHSIRMREAPAEAQERWAANQRALRRELLSVSK
ncbi:MAG: helix-turn-helix domain-containing protein [Kiritimatiellaeota bacterium]|nr:helix-turn-helix domain-containing protein [Kiritimatiellota bacterium]